MVGFILMTMILMGGHLSLRAFHPLNVTDTLCRQTGKGVKYLRGVSCPPHHSAKTKTQTSEHTKTCKQKQTSMQTGKGVKYLRDLSSTQCKHKQPNTHKSHKLKQANTKTKYKQTIKHSKVSSVREVDPPRNANTAFNPLYTAQTIHAMFACIACMKVEMKQCLWVQRFRMRLFQSS